MSLTQAEYDTIMSSIKHFDDIGKAIDLGPAPIQWSRKILMKNSHENLILDFYRGSIELRKFTINHRVRQSIVLFRYDEKGRHTNPDGIYFDGPHIHLYKEGFDDKFAYPVTEIEVLPTDNMYTIFSKVLRFCNIVTYPTINLALFE